MTFRERIESFAFDRTPEALTVLRPVPGYGLSVTLFVLAYVIRWELDSVLPAGFPFLTFFPAIVLTAFVAGVGPGTLCAALSGGAAWYYFIEPRGSFQSTGSTMLAVLFFVFIAVVDLTLIHATQRANRQLRTRRALTARLYAEQKTMFEELQHRVANNMAFVSSLLQLDRRRVAANPGDAVAVIDEAAERIATMGRIHRRLYDPASIDRPIEGHLRDVCDDLLRSTGAQRVTCTVAAADIRIGLDRLVPLSLLVAELLTNCIKHAFVGRDAGAVAVTLAPGDAGRLVMVIRDDGVGVGSRDPDADGRGLGTRIVHGLAAQLQGKLTISRDNGTVAYLDFPA